MIHIEPLGVTPNPLALNIVVFGKEPNRCTYDMHHTRILYETDTLCAPHEYTFVSARKAIRCLVAIHATR